jgi:hypothetical protein
MFRIHYNIYNNTIFSIGNKLLALIHQLTSLITLVYKKGRHKRITTSNTLSTPLQFHHLASAHDTMLICPSDFPFA